jgi:hypothetical protein
MVVGSRVQVWHGTADKTTGGLGKKDLFQDKYGRIRSRAVSRVAKKLNNLGERKIRKGTHQFIAGGSTRTPIVSRKFKAGVSTRSALKKFPDKVKEALRSRDGPLLLKLIHKDGQAVKKVIEDDYFDGNMSKDIENLNPLELGSELFHTLMALFDCPPKPLSVCLYVAQKIIVSTVKWLDQLKPNEFTQPLQKIAKEIAFYPLWQNLVLEGGIYTGQVASPYLNLQSPKLFAILSASGTLIPGRKSYISTANNPENRPSLERKRYASNYDLLMENKEVSDVVKGGELRQHLKTTLADLLGKLPSDAAITSFLARYRSLDPTGQDRIIFEQMVRNYVERGGDVPDVRNDNCSICFGDIEGRNKMCIENRHAFHVECLDAWLQNNDSCPDCRSTQGFVVNRMTKRKRSSSGVGGKEAEK